MKINKSDKRARRRALIEFALRKGIKNIRTWVRLHEFLYYKQSLAQK